MPMDSEEFYDTRIRREDYQENEEFFKVSADRLQQIGQVSGLPATRVRRICTYPWPDANVHQRWLDEASIAEIAHWVRFIDRLEASDQR